MTELYDLIVEGGTVVNADAITPATVLIKDGRVSGLLDPAASLPRAERVVSAHGSLVMPGGVDPHCHIGQALGEFHQLDDYESATVAALWGGTTTVIDFAIPADPSERPMDVIEHRLQLAGSARCNTAMHGCVIEWDDTSADQVAEAVKLGVRTIKLFTTYRDVVKANSRTILEVTKALRGYDGLALVHAEANHVIEDAQHGAASEGRLDSSQHAGTRPEIAESAAVSSVLSIADHLGASVYFVHQTTPEAVDLVRAARRRGARAYTETCPHYLSLDSSSYGEERPDRFVCCPPLRDRGTVDQLVARAVTGQIDTLGSDHCCYSLTQKAVHSEDVTRMPNGMPGVETRLPVSFTTLVKENGLSLDRFVAMFSRNPAVLNGLPSKGLIAPGADADLIVVDPNEERVVSVEDLHMATDYTPYEGRRLSGWASTVVLGGEVVLDADGFHDPGAGNRHLSSQPLPPGLLT